LAAAMAALPAGLALKLSDVFAEATQDSEFKFNDTVSVTGAKSSRSRR
jgi:hypothetical protein